MLACLAPPTSTSTSGPDAADAADAVNLPEPAPKSQPPRPLQAIYIAPPDPFPEVEDFVATSTIQYHLDLTRYALPMRPALEAYLGDRTAVKAIFMGTRRTDPHCECLTHFSPTDADWPQFMRVNPMIDWHYAEIWAVSIFCLSTVSVPSASYEGGGIPRGEGRTNTGRQTADTDSSSGTSAFPIAAYTSRAFRLSAA